MCWVIMGAFNSDLLSNLFSKWGQRWNFLFLLSSMMISWKEALNTLCTRTFMCPWWLLEQPDGQTLEWPMSLDSMATAFDSYISVGPHACDPVLKCFPINHYTEAGTIMADILHTFSMHFWTKHWLEFEFVPECPIGTLIHIWWLDAYYATTYYMNQCWPYASPGLDETVLIPFDQNIPTLHKQFCIFNYFCQEW